MSSRASPATYFGAIPNKDKAGEAATWHQLASLDLNEGNFPNALKNLAQSLAIAQEIGDKAGEAATWHQLASIDLNEKHYSAAREKLAKSLTIRQEIGDKAGEAANWHQLASIDMGEGSYSTAREKFTTALTILQTIANRATEAATWHGLASIDFCERHYTAAWDKYIIALTIDQDVGNKAGEGDSWAQLGIIAWRTGRKFEAVTLEAISFLLLEAIGSGQKTQVWNNLIGMCGDLSYSQEQFDELLRSAMTSYHQDRGAALLKAAFPNEA
ncbi:MAG TPA: tetratricopeptide repeat protein [Urbifossiella sp.]|jgi:tetratricopeptide (TPR) repeat protein|nr:tetratricopeptide repeat protein [Urbifossiella sp.]